MAGDIFVNNAMMGIMECFAVTIVMFTLDRLSRRWATMSTFLGSSICYLLTGFLEVYGGERGASASTFFAIAGKFFSSACYSCTYIYSAELYPTSCRSTGFGSMFLSSRISQIIIPFIVEGKISSNPLIPDHFFF